MESSEYRRMKVSDLGILFIFKKSKMIGILFALILSVFMIFILWLNSNKAGEFRSKIKEVILKELTQGKPLPPGEVVDAIYVLGGSERALTYKFQVVAELYKNQVSDKILILSQQGVARVNEDIERNDMNDTRSIKQLKSLGVPEEKIEPIKLGEGFFGTLTEAKYVSEFVRQRSYTSILLISQAFHTKRVKLSFEKYLPSEGFSFYTQNSTDTQTLSETLIEFLKLKFYQHLLL